MVLISFLSFCYHNIRMRKKLVFIMVLCLGIFLAVSESFPLCVKTSSANLRKGPGKKYEKTWEVFKYMPLKKLAKKGNWYKVKDVDGDIHWIFGGLVTDKYKCAVVKVDKANIRTGPGKKYRFSELSPAIRYDSFRVLKIKGKWVKVKDEFGDTGWIFRKLLWIQ